MTEPIDKKAFVGHIRGKTDDQPGAVNEINSAIKGGAKTVQEVADAGLDTRDSKITSVDMGKTEEN